MEYGHKQCIWTLLYGLLWTVTVTSGATEENHQVEMKLYQASKSEWESSGRDKFADIVADQANTYCEGNLEACKMKQLRTDFTDGHYEEASAVKEKAYLVVTFSLALATPTDMIDGHTSDTHLNKKALQAVTANSVEKLREETDLKIVEVDEESQPLPPDNTLNIAISVSAIGILIVMIIVLLVMQHKCGKKSHEDEKMDNKERVTVA